MVKTLSHHRHYIVQLADKSWHYVNPDEGKSAMVAWSQGHPVIVKKMAIANHMVSIIRPCTQEEEQEAHEYERTQKRKEALTSGKVRIEERIENGELKIIQRGDFEEQEPKEIQDDGFVKLSKIIDDNNT